MSGGVEGEVNLSSGTGAWRFESSIYILGGLEASADWGAGKSKPLPRNWGLEVWKFHLHARRAGGLGRFEFLKQKCCHLSVCGVVRFLCEVQNSPSPPVCFPSQRSSAPLPSLAFCGVSQLLWRPLARVASLGSCGIPQLLWRPLAPVAAWSCASARVASLVSCGVPQSLPVASLSSSGIPQLLWLPSAPDL